MICKRMVKTMGNNLSKNFKYFIDHYKEIFSKYGHSFIVLKNESVLAAYPSFSEAYRNTIKTEQLGDFNIQECNGNETGYTNYIASCEVFKHE